MGITTKISQQLEGKSLLRPNHTKQFARQKPPPPRGPRTNQEMSAKVREFPGSESPTRQHWNTISRHGQALNTTCLEDRNPRAHSNSTGHRLPRGDASQNTDHALHTWLGKTDLSCSYDLLHTSVFMFFTHFFTPTHTYQKYSNIYS